jgi:hypothetical protein
LLGRFAGSGLTVTAFCEREAISAASFYRWRALSAGAGAEDQRSVAVRERTAPSAVGFVELGALRAVGLLICMYILHQAKSRHN